MVRVKVFGVVAVMAAGLALATSARAASPAVDPSERGGGEPMITFVAGGCGPGFHPNPWGRCRPNDRGYGYGGYGGYGGPRRFYEGRRYGYEEGYARRRAYEDDRPRRFYDGD